MTDLEMIKRCAKKFGFEPYEDQSQWKLEAPAIACKLGTWSGECIVYNPLTDDAQAMALVKKFEINIGPDVKDVFGWTASDYDGSGEVFNTDLNRAIVECVARMP